MIDVKVLKSENGMVINLSPLDLTFSKFNRGLDQRHVSELKNAIKRRNLLHLNPIKVNHTSEIIDGQHRVQAAIELGLTVVPCLIIDASVHHAQILNQHGKNWEVMDFARYWAHFGKKDYIKYVEFVELSGLAATTSITLLSGLTANAGGVSLRNFKAGDFKVKDVDYAYRFVDKLEFFKKYLASSYYDRSFVTAFWKVYNHRMYMHDRMIHKVEVVGLFKCMNVSQYIDQFENIYNWKVRSDEKVKFKD